MPITRSRGKPVVCNATQAITSSGFETIMMIESGATRAISDDTEPTMRALVFSRSSRDIPGLRAIPAVTMKMSDPAASS